MISKLIRVIFILGALGAVTFVVMEHSSYTSMLPEDYNTIEKLLHIAPKEVAKPVVTPAPASREVADTVATESTGQNEAVDTTKIEKTKN